MVTSAAKMKNTPENTWPTSQSFELVVMLENAGSVVAAILKSGLGASVPSAFKRVAHIASSFDGWGMGQVHLLPRPVFQRVFEFVEGVANWP